MRPEVSKFTKELQQLFNGNISEIAKQTGFHVRNSGKINPILFLEMVVLLYNDHKEDSLETLCERLRSKYNIEISKQGLDQRFNSRASEFLLEVIRKIMEIQYAPPLKMSPYLDSFSKVKIKDSTEFKGSPQNADVYPGFNGPGTASCFQVQLEIDLRTGKIEDLFLTSALNSDHKDALDTKESILPNELIIRDLGYVSQDRLNEINNINSFYLNKIKRSVNLYNKDLDFVSYGTLYRKLKKSNGGILEDEFYAGNKINHTSRLIYTLVPDKVYKERIDKLKKSRKGKAITKEERCRSSINILITNVDSVRLPAQVAVDLYRLRWQIEIEFKSWKSIVKIASIKDTKTPRTECYILGKLIWLLLRNQAKIFVMHLNKFPSGISTIKFARMEKLKKEMMCNLSGEQIVIFINNMLGIPEKLLRREGKNTNKNAEKYLSIVMI